MFRAISFPLFLCFLCLCLRASGLSLGLSQAQGSKIGRGLGFGLVHPRSTSFIGLHSRQAGAMPPDSIPPECQASCQPFLDMSDECAPTPTTANITCVCSDTTANAILQCVNCIANSSVGPVFIAEEQPKLNNLSAVCQEVGHPFNESLQIKLASDQSSSVALSTLSLSVSQLGSLVLVLVCLMRI